MDNIDKNIKQLLIDKTCKHEYVSINPSGELICTKCSKNLSGDNSLLEVIPSPGLGLTIKTD